MLKKIKIKFIDFWPDFIETDNFLYALLSKYYTIEFSEKPDLLFYSNFGIEHLKYTCKKVYYTGEYKKPNYSYCDYSFSYENDSENNFHLPHFVEYDYFFDIKDRDIHKDILYYQNTKKEKFCSFMAANKNALDRIEFVKKLMYYKKVDCSGPVLYNMKKKENVGKVHNGVYINWRKEKLDVIKHYKFTIAFENFRAMNYITEKIYQPLLVKSIPIYWGAPNIDEYFNPKCYIDVSKFETFDDAIKEIKEIDNNIDKYLSYFKEPIILPSSKLINLSEEKIYWKLKELLDNPLIPIGKKKIIKNYTLYFAKKFKRKIATYVKRP